MSKEINYQAINGIALAYLGDAEYEVYIRRHLIEGHDQTEPLTPRGNPLRVSKGPSGVN